MIEVQETNITEVRKAAVSRHQFARAAAPALLIIFAAWLSILAHRPSMPASTEVDPIQFSSARAMQHVSAIADKPHPIGSMEAASVRDYIFGQFAELSLNPTIQTATVMGKLRTASQ